MNSAARPPRKPSRCWQPLGWLVTLAAAAVLAFGSSAGAQRGTPSPGVNVRSFHPPQVNRGALRIRPPVERGIRRARPSRERQATNPRYPRDPDRPRRPRHPRPDIPGIVIPGIVIPGIIGVIGTPPTEPVRPEPAYQPPPRYQPPPARPRRPARTVNLPPQPPLPPQRPSAVAGSGVPPAGEQRFVPDEVVVQLPPGTTLQALAALEARHQLVRLETQTFELTGESMVRWRIPDQRSVRAVITALEADAGIAAAQPNYLFVLSQDTPPQGTTGLNKGDPAQYALGKLNLPEAHRLARGDKVLIGVIDSGVDGAHPELAGMIAGSYDPLPGEAPHSHGTAIAGTIVAHARLLGVAPASRILAARAFGGESATAQATTFNILKSIDWAARNGARVINMSFAGPRDPAIGRHLAAAHKKNIVLIAAAGNAGPKSPPLYPAANANVVAVAATDSRDKLFDLSNRGKHITVSAPGVDIIAPAPRGAYQITSGTSIAAAYVSGLAALLIDRNPDITPDRVRAVLQATARDLGKRGRDPEYGAGLADALRALRSVQPAADVVTSRRR